MFGLLRLTMQFCAQNPIWILTCPCASSVVGLKPLLGIGPDGTDRLSNRGILESPGLSHASFVYLNLGVSSCIRRSRYP